MLADGSGVCVDRKCHCSLKRKRNSSMAVRKSMRKSAPRGGVLGQRLCHSRLPLPAGAGQVGIRLESGAFQNVENAPLARDLVVLEKERDFFLCRIRPVGSMD